MGHVQEKQSDIGGGFRQVAGDLWETEPFIAPSGPRYIRWLAVFFLHGYIICLINS